MSRDAPARRLLSQLVDEQDLETEPIAELRADLAALDIDPAPAIASARRLAGGASSPAVSLLGRIAEAEESDEEIRRVERADIAGIRRGLEQGTAAAAIAKAQRAAGGDSNIVALRRRRSRRLLYGLCGVTAALAASLVLVVGLTEPQRFAQPPDSGVTDFFSGGSPALKDSPSGQGQQLTGGNLQSLDQAVAPKEPPAVLRSDDAAGAPKSETDANALEGGGRANQLEGSARFRADVEDKQSALGEGLQPAPAPPAAPADSKAARNELAAPLKEKQQTGPTTVEPAAVDAPAQTEAATMSASDSRMRDAAAAEEEARATVGAGSSSRFLPFGLTRPVTALLIVDPKLVPANLRQADYPTGDLPARLADARHLAGAGRVAALVTLQLADRTADAAIVFASDERQLGSLRRKSDADAASTPVAAVAQPYDLILLDGR